MLTSGIGSSNIAGSSGLRTDAFTELCSELYQPMLSHRRDCLVA